jgi:orotate phosphoribosyltransferase
VASENFKNANVDLFTLSNYENLLPLAVSKKYISEQEQQTLMEWRVSPSTWGLKV